MSSADNQFEKIYREYFRMVYLYALSLSRSEAQAEEITQETFFQALEHLDSFRGDCKVSTWLCQIAKNIWISLRKNTNITER